MQSLHVYRIRAIFGSACLSVIHITDKFCKLPRSIFSLFYNISQVTTFCNFASQDPCWTGRFHSSFSNQNLVDKSTEHSEGSTSHLCVPLAEPLR